MFGRIERWIPNIFNFQMGITLELSSKVLKGLEYLGQNCKWQTLSKLGTIYMSSSVNIENDLAFSIWKFQIMAKRMTSLKLTFWFSTSKILQSNDFQIEHSIWCWTFFQKAYNFTLWRSSLKFMFIMKLQNNKTWFQDFHYGVPRIEGVPRILYISM